MVQSISTKELNSLNSKKGIKQFLKENGSFDDMLNSVTAKVQGGVTFQIFLNQNN